MATTVKTTAIGSLPHHNVDSALGFSFRMGIPFLPQIPIRNPWEFMIAQALEGLPGIEIESDGSVQLDVNVWHSRAHSLNERLLAAFADGATRPDAYQAFEPSAATSSSWQPFLWELQETGAKLAKIQIAGPLTAQWALRLKDESRIDRFPDIATQIYRLVLARSIAMTRTLKSLGITPVLYLDEPGLYGLSATHPRHIVALQELRLMVQTLRKEGVQVGLHCCSNTDWSAVLSLGLNILSLDTQLSLENLLNRAEAVEKFLDGGGIFSLGVIPTDRSAPLPRPREIMSRLVDRLSAVWSQKPERVRQVISQSIYTPACGLALHSTQEAEAVLACLLEFGDFCRESF